MTVPRSLSPLSKVTSSLRYNPYETPFTVLGVSSSISHETLSPSGPWCAARSCSSRELRHNSCHVLLFVLFASGLTPHRCFSLSVRTFLCIVYYACHPLYNSLSFLPHPCHLHQHTCFHSFLSFSPRPLLSALPSLSVRLLSPQTDLGRFYWSLSNAWVPVKVKVNKSKASC